VILRELAEVDAETARLERLIAAKQLEMQEVEASFAVSRARLEVLLGT
jgi:predicted  nucleic acid-binding Zn-ribbon protein